MRRMTALSIELPLELFGGRNNYRLNVQLTLWMGHINLTMHR